MVASGRPQSGLMPRLSCFFSSRRRHTRLQGDWSSDVCSSDLTGLFTGIAPVLTAGRLDLVSALKDSSRSATGRGGQASRSALVVAEIAITLVLVFAAGLLTRSLIVAQTANPGFV